MQESYEIIFINDGSSDGSLEILLQLRLEDSRVKIVDFSRNFGHQMAISAGIDKSCGRAVVVMDADLQDPPEAIPELANKWKDGYEVIYAVRKCRRENVMKRVFCAIFYRLLQKISYLDIPLDSGDFSLLDRRVVNCLKLMPERNRFIRGLRTWVGFRQAGVEYVRDKRWAGAPKYSTSALLKLAYDGLFSFSYAPLKLATNLGFLVSLLALIGILAVIYLRLRNAIPIGGWASTIVIVLLLSGIQLIFLGIIGEYLGRVFDESKRRPPYIVRDEIGFNDEKK